MFSLIIITSPTVVSAHTTTPTISTESISPGIQLYGNETGYRYRVYNGKLYKRLWSYTYGRWEDPVWTPV